MNRHTNILTANDRVLIAAIGTAIVGDGPYEAYNLYGMDIIIQEPQLVIQALAEAAEAATDGRRTVTQVPSIMFDRAVMGAALYLMVHNKHEVHHPNHDNSERLLILCPASNGFIYPAERATAKDIARREAHEVVASRRYAQRETGMQMSNDFLATMATNLRNVVNAFLPDLTSAQRQDLMEVVNFGSPNLEKIATACAILDFPLHALTSPLPDS